VAISHPLDPVPQDSDEPGASVFRDNCLSFAVLY
jgi:hypothetical protein